MCVSRFRSGHVATLPSNGSATLWPTHNRFWLPFPQSGNSKHILRKLGNSLPCKTTLGNSSAETLKHTRRKQRHSRNREGRGAMVSSSIRLRPSSRGKPFLYFKGPAREAHLMRIEDIAHAFSQAIGQPVDSSNPKTRELLQNMHDAIREGIRGTHPSRGEKRHSIFISSTPAGPIALHVKRSGRNVLVSQYPFSHSVTPGGLYGGSDPFNCLKGILRQGFRTRRLESNVVIARRYFIDRLYAEASGHSQTQGDRYSIEIMAPAHELAEYSTNLRRSTPDQVLHVNILLPQGLSQRQKEARRKFYKRELGSVPFSFVEGKVHTLLE